MAEVKSDLRLLVGKSLEWRPLARPRNTWEQDIKIGISVRILINSYQDRDYWRTLANVAFNILVP